jgi:hypothetical protein
VSRPHQSESASVPAPGLPRLSTSGKRPRRPRTAEPWADFEEWCLRRDLPSMPASGAIIAAYIADRCREVDDNGELAHSYDQMKGWVDLIDQRRVQLGHTRLRTSRPVSEILLRLNPRRAAPRPTDAAAPLQTLKRVLRWVDSDEPLDRGTQDRDRALLLIGAAGALTYQELAELRVGDVLTDPRDGLRVTTGSTDTVWIPAVPAAIFCAPCAHRRWLLRYRSSNSPSPMPEDPFGGDVHQCFSAEPHNAELIGAPMFPRIGSDLFARMTAREVAWIVDSRLADAQASRSDIDGVRNELMLREVIASLGSSA